MRKKQLLLRSLVLVFFLVLSAAASAEAAVPTQDSSSYVTYKVEFLPGLYNRLCVGDSRSISFFVSRNELPDKPVPEEPGDHLTLAPLRIRTARVSTTLGSLSQSEFKVISPFHGFTTKYTAESPGIETITIQMEDGNTVTHSFEVRDSCDFKLSFFAHQREETDQGGFDAFFHGSGDFGIDRVAPESVALTGRGTDKVTLGIWAQNSAAADLFSCNMVPIQSRGAFEIGGVLQPPPLDFMHLTLFFDPIQFPAEMVFNCSAVGLGAIEFRAPIGGTTGDANEMGLAGILLPSTGGTYDFSQSGYTGILTVTPRR